MATLLGVKSRLRAIGTSGIDEQVGQRALHVVPLDAAGDLHPERVAELELVEQVAGDEFVVLGSNRPLCGPGSGPAQ